MRISSKVATVESIDLGTDLGHQVSIVVPTWRRAQWLGKCLQSILVQDPPPDEVIVVGRRSDESARQVVQRWSTRDFPVRWVEVDEEGHIPPIRKGLQEANGQIVVFVDDDVEADADWLCNLLSPFFDARLAAVGGRVQTPGWQGVLHRDAGAIRWYGKHIGNVSELAGESPREVSAVMEGNWAWRTQILRSLKFDPVFFEDDAVMYGLDLCLQAKARGYKIVYQPKARVSHHAAPRDPALDRDDRSSRIRTYSRNYTYIALKHFRGFRRIVFLAWWWLIGERGSYGVATAGYDLFNPRRRNIPALVDAAMTGKWEGVRAWHTARR